MSGHRQRSTRAARQSGAHPYAFAVPTAMLMALLLLLGAVACGSTQTIDTTRTFAGQPAGLITTRVRLLAGCVEQAGAQLEPGPPRPHKGRVAARAGSVSALYLGAVVWPNGAYSDLWMGFTPLQAAMTASQLNRSQAEALGVSKVQAAFSYGRAVSAPGDSEQFAELSELEKLGEVPPETVARVDACLRATAS